jgi:tRNA modification GTPase
MLIRGAVRHVRCLSTPFRWGRGSFTAWRRTQDVSTTSRRAAVPHPESRIRHKDVTATADTVYALSTAPGRAAIAVIRITGPACLDIYGSLCPNKPFPAPRTAALRKLYRPSATSSDLVEVLDAAALVLYFPAPLTVTGEDVLELHVHGGPAIVRSILNAIPECAASRTRRRPAEYSHIRPAEAGEFTKRAFYNNRLTLPQAEALGDSLAAETEQQRRLAVLGTESGLAERYESWRQLLLYARGELEALIDFSEDQHFDESPAQFMSSVSAQVAGLQAQLGVHIGNASRGELLRSGIRVALLGAPNAGKSSLLNRIVGREAAIVSAEEGTTRDIVDVSVDLSGWLCRFGDMAGLRTSPSTVTQSVAPLGAIEAEGIRRARARALQSDIVIVLLALNATGSKGTTLQMNDEVRAAATECLAAGKTVVVAINKADLIPDLLSSASTKAAMQRYVYNALPDLPCENIHFLSCVPDSGSSAAQHSATSVQAFLSALTQTFSKMTSALTSHDPLSGTELSPAEAQAYWAASLSITHRQTVYLRECLGHIDDFLAAASHPTTPSSASVTSAASDMADDNNTKTNTNDTERVKDTEIETEIDIVKAAEHLRYAASCLAKITGRGEGGDVEDVLGVVFEK